MCVSHNTFWNTVCRMTDVDIQGVSKKVDNFETALNLAKRLEVWSFLLMYIAWVLTV